MTGKARYGADVVLPHMLVAVIARPPVVGGKVARLDATRALAVPGVKQVLTLPAPKAPYGFQPLGGVAVLATNTYAAMKGRAALEIAWEHGENASYDSGSFREKMLASVRAPGTTKRNTGDAPAAIAAAAKKVSAEYTVPHLAHAAMEPPCALAHVNGGTCEIWAPTQHPQAAMTQVAKTLGIDEKQVTVHVTYLGGGFGRKSKPDFVAEAAWLAREAGVPVRVQWTRTDDLQHGYNHAVSAQRLEAGLDAAGKVVGLLHRTAFPPIPSTFEKTISPSDGELGQGLLDLPLAVPAVRVEAVDTPNHVRGRTPAGLASSSSGRARCSRGEEGAAAEEEEEEEGGAHPRCAFRAAPLPDVARRAPWEGDGNVGWGGVAEGDAGVAHEAKAVRSTTWSPSKWAVKVA